MVFLRKCFIRWLDSTCILLLINCFETNAFFQSFYLKNCFSEKITNSPENKFKVLAVFAVLAVEALKVSQ